MQPTQVVEKIQGLPEPLLREVEDFIDFLLSRYQLESVLTTDEYPPVVMSHLVEAGGAFVWLDDPAEDIYSDADGERV